MALDRLVDTDDSGSGLDGTIHDNDWLQALNDTIDARWSVMTITLTGSQNNVSITDSGIEADVLICNNASDLTITGFAAPASPSKPGKKLVVLAGGAGHVFLTNNSGSSSAGNRLSNFAVSGNTPLAAGVGRAVYCYMNSTWVLIQHEQGAWITPTFAAGNYTSSAGSWTVAAGDAPAMKYELRGRTLTVSWYIQTTSVSGTPAELRIGNGAWGGFTAVSHAVVAPIIAVNAGATNEPAYAQITAATDTYISIYQLDAGPWSNATDTTGVYGQLTFDVD